MFHLPMIQQVQMGKEIDFSKLDTAVSSTVVKFEHLKRLMEQCINFIHTMKNIHFSFPQFKEKHSLFS